MIFDYLGEPMTFTQWGNGKPIGDGNFIYTYLAEDGLVYWDDHPPYSKFSFICEYSKF